LILRPAENQSLGTPRAACPVFRFSFFFFFPATLPNAPVPGRSLDPGRPHHQLDRINGGPCSAIGFFRLTATHLQTTAPGVTKRRTARSASRPQFVAVYLIVSISATPGNGQGFLKNKNSIELGLRQRVRLPSSPRGFLVAMRKNNAIELVADSRSRQTARGRGRKGNADPHTEKSIARSVSCKS